MKLNFKSGSDWNTQTIRRYKPTRDFINKFNPHGRLLDIGGVNKMGMLLAGEFKLDYETTTADLDYTLDATKKYDTIFMFEVLEHLMNPLLCLNNIKKHCKKDTQFYLSVPRQQHLFWDCHHFHEFDKIRFEHLIKSAGFEIEAQSKHVARFNWSFYFTGIRPILRLLFFKPIYYLYKLR